MLSILEAEVHIFDYDKGLDKYFEEAAEKYGDSIALKFEEKSITYTELIEKEFKESISADTLYKYSLEELSEFIDKLNI